VFQSVRVIFADERLKHLVIFDASEPEVRDTNFVLQVIDISRLVLLLLYLVLFLFVFSLDDTGNDCLELGVSLVKDWHVL